MAPCHPEKSVSSSGCPRPFMTKLERVISQVRRSLAGPRLSSCLWLLSLCLDSLYLIPSCQKSPFNALLLSKTFSDLPTSCSHPLDLHCLCQSNTCISVVYIWQRVGTQKKKKKIVHEQINFIYHTIKILSLSSLLNSELSLREVDNKVMYVVEKAKLS